MKWEDNRCVKIYKELTISTLHVLSRNSSREDDVKRAETQSRQRQLWQVFTRCIPKIQISRPHQLAWWI